MQIIEKNVFVHRFDDAQYAFSRYTYSLSDDAATWSRTKETILIAWDLGSGDTVRGTRRFVMFDTSYLLDTTTLQKTRFNTKLATMAVSRDDWLFCITSDSMFADGNTPTGMILYSANKQYIFDIVHAFGIGVNINNNRPFVLVDAANTAKNAVVNCPIDAIVWHGPRKQSDYAMCGDVIYSVHGYAYDGGPAKGYESHSPEHEQYRVGLSVFMQDNRVDTCAALRDDPVSNVLIYPRCDMLNDHDILVTQRSARYTAGHPQHTKVLIYDVRNCMIALMPRIQCDGVLYVAN